MISKTVADNRFRSLSHLIDVLADEAPNDRLKRLADAMGDILDDLYIQVQNSLNEG